MNIQLCRIGAKMLHHRAGRRRRFGLRHTDQDSVRHHRATANQIEISIGDRFVVSLKIEHAPLIRRGRSEAGTEQLLIVVVPLLEMMRREEHPLVPHDFAIPAHILVIVSDLESKGILFSEVRFVNGLFKLTR